MEGVDLMDQRNINEPHSAYNAPVPPAQPPVQPPVSPVVPEGQGRQSRFKNYCNRHGFRPFAVRIVILLLVLLIAFAIFTGISTATIVKSRTTALGLKDIGELATQAGFYTNVQMISGSREIFGINIPLTEKKYIFGYDGVIKAGIDFADIKVIVDEMTRVITVTLPDTVLQSALTLKITGLPAKAKLQAPEGGVIYRDAKGDVFLTTPVIGKNITNHPAGNLVKAYEAEIKVGHGETVAQEITFGKTVKFAGMRLLQFGDLPDGFNINLRLVTPDGAEVPFNFAKYDKWVKLDNAWGSWRLFPQLPDEKALPITAIRYNAVQAFKKVEVWAEGD